MNESTAALLTTIAENMPKIKAQGIAEGQANKIYETLTFSNGISIEAREDGIFIVNEENRAEKLFDANTAIITAMQSDYASEADMAHTAYYDPQMRELKGTYVYEQGDVANATVPIEDGSVFSYGMVTNSIFGFSNPEQYEVGFTSALYFKTPDVIPENYSQFPADIYFKGDSTDEGAFVPEANMRYTIVFDFDGYMVNAYVSGVTTV